MSDHIEYIASITGREHVGLGSDFDGIQSTPIGLENVSKYPYLVSARTTKPERPSLTMSAFSSPNSSVAVGTIRKLWVLQAVSLEKAEGVSTTESLHMQAISSGLSKRLKRCRGRWKASSPRWPCTTSDRTFHGIGLCRPTCIVWCSDLLFAKLWSKDHPASGLADEIRQQRRDRGALTQLGSATTAQTHSRRAALAQSLPRISSRLPCAYLVLHVELEDGGSCPTPHQRLCPSLEGG